jgi:acetyl-CoA acetyltransferase
MRQEVIVSTARTPIAKAYEIEDITTGCASTQGSTGVNVARHSSLAVTIDRHL